MGKMKYGEKAKNPKMAFARLLKTVFEGRMFMIPIIILCILVTSVATIYSASFIGSFIDEIVVPLKGVENPDFGPAVKYLVKFALVVSVSLVASFLSSFLMVGIAQGSIYDLRIKMFAKLESLPISYFDQNTRGSLMSRFANDTDTLNQLVSNGLTGMLTSVITLVMVFFSMLLNSWILTIVIVAFIFITLRTTMAVAKRSGKYYKAQQKNLGDVNGFIEEMINGQRVIKVFTHEEKSKEDFGVLNENLNVAMARANGWAGTMGPINNNLGHLQYVVLVLVGALSIIFKPSIYTIGGLAAFLQLSKSFSSNIGNLSQQANNILHDLAGAERVFALLDETPDSDEGKVTLVRVTSHDEKMEETSVRTGKWAWKVPHEGGKNELVPLKGSV
ncbi:MAG: ABC transporter ATP-binding protein, partial [Spirochaetales bacterium]|nr:ABC transporter ATP-binding protein [Candidatus Physcosoma equi]